MSINKKSINDFIQKRGSFTMVPNEIWELNNIDHLSKVIWCYLYSQDPDWSSSRNNVARNLGMGVHTVSNHVNKLEELGMVVVDRTQESWSFEILPPDKWSCHGSGAKQIQSHHGSTTEAATAPVPELPRLHTKESIINNNNIHNEYNDYDRILDILNNNVSMTDFQRKVIDTAMPYLKKGRQLSVKQKTVLKDLLSLKLEKNSGNGETNSLLRVITIDELVQIVQKHRGDPYALVEELEQLGEANRLFKGAMVAVCKAYPESGVMMFEECEAFRRAVNDSDRFSSVRVSLNGLLLKERKKIIDAESI